MIDEAALLRFFGEHSGLGEAESRAAMHAVLRALGEVLTADEASLVARELPSSWALMLVETNHGRAYERERFIESVARIEGVPVGVALDHATTACAALGHHLGPETLVKLSRALGSLFEVTPEGRPAPRQRHSSSAPPRMNLAEGHAGSLHPLASASPPGAQSHSVAEANPHAESKLSSAKGLTQEALGESMATGKPPSPKHTLGEG